MDSSTEKVEGEEEEVSKEVALDAEDMDPKEVLFGGETVKVQIPVPDARIFNNLAEYYSKTFAKKNEKRSEENLTRQLTAVTASSSSSAERFANFKMKPLSEGELKRPRRQRKAAKSVLDKMEESCGPLSILYRAIGQSIRILVRRRKTCALREERFSWISGLLVAFDKHLNMALQEAAEEYQHQRGQATIKIRKCTRQLLVRGDNVVLVACDASPPNAAAVSSS